MSRLGLNLAGHSALSARYALPNLTRCNGSPLMSEKPNKSRFNIGSFLVFLAGFIIIIIVVLFFYYLCCE